MGLARRIIAGLAATVLLAAATYVFGIAPRAADAQMNAVEATPLAPISAESQALHDTLKVADLHADTLLWMRNPEKRHRRGQTDLPRFREGGMFLQVFTAVTKSPAGQNYEANDGGSDRITLLALSQRWPVDTWRSLEARARFQARRLQKIAARDERFFLIRTKADLEAALAARRADPSVMAGILGIEGAHPLEGDLAAIDRLYEEGHRVVGLQHFFDNELGGSLHGHSGGGLTPFGRAAVDKMAAKGMIFDIAHSSPAVVQDLLGRYAGPVIISHTGIKSVCDTPRNVDDAILAEVAARGGLIGIGFWDAAVCDISPDGIAASIVAGIEKFGVSAIALGSDFDGSVTTAFDVSQMASLTDALRRAGLSDEHIAKVMGENQIAFFRSHLPD